MKITVKQLRAVIAESIATDDSITIEQLAEYSPEAATAALQLDEGERGLVFWVLDSPSATNEEELEDWLNDDWDTLCVEHGGQHYVLFAGDSVDDEYGWMWDESSHDWISYNF